MSRVISRLRVRSPNNLTGDSDAGGLWTTLGIARGLIDNLAIIDVENLPILSLHYFKPGIELVK